MRRLIYIFMAMFVSLAIVAVHASTFKPPKPAAQNATSVKPAKKPAKPSKPSKPKQVRCNECGELVNPSDFNNSSGMCDDCDEHQRNISKFFPASKSRTEKIVSDAQAAALSELMSSPREFDVNGVKFKMMPVIGGSFTMGGTNEQRGETRADEFPAHGVTLDSYFMGQTEVTEGLWRAVMGDLPGKLHLGDNYPVTGVSWHDCCAFLSRLGSITNLSFRLPTEAEWEYAARGGVKSNSYRYAGGDRLADVGWFWDNAEGHVQPVCGKKSNELGLYDMSGNVWEWCSDTYGAYASYSQKNPTGASSGDYAVARGGSSSYYNSFCRVSTRINWLRTDSFKDIGFRLALDADSIQQYDKNKSVREVVSDNKAKRALTQTTATTRPSTPASGSGFSVKNYTVNGASFKMVAVKGGTFTMGATSEQGRDADGDEKPAHQVTLDDFMIGETEVTEALWTAVMGSNPSYNKKGDNYPVQTVSWDDCQTFVTKLNRLTGEKFRLPTEAEWEYAARGGNQSQGYKYSGGNTIDDVAWYDGNSGSAKHPVATKAPNELGLYDMSGNVWEWCQDWYWYGYSSGAQTNPTGPASGSHRVFRGGCWDYSARYCRVSDRRNCTPSNTDINLGLRLAR